MFKTEYEHNLTQQIYLTAETWDIVLKAKNSTVQIIQKNAGKKTSKVLIN